MGNGIHMQAWKPVISTRHGKELLSKSIQSTTTKGDSGIDNLTCLSGDDTKLGTDHTKADMYESSNSKRLLPINCCLLVFFFASEGCAC